MIGRVDGGHSFRRLGEGELAGVDFLTLADDAGYGAEAGGHPRAPRPGEARQLVLEHPGVQFPRLAVDVDIGAGEARAEHRDAMPRRALDQVVDKGVLGSPDRVGVEVGRRHEGLGINPSRMGGAKHQRSERLPRRRIGKLEGFVGAVFGSRDDKWIDHPAIVVEASRRVKCRFRTKAEGVVDEFGNRGGGPRRRGDRPAPPPRSDPAARLALRQLRRRPPGRLVPRLRTARRGLPSFDPPFADGGGGGAHPPRRPVLGHRALARAASGQADPGLHRRPSRRADPAAAAVPGCPAAGVLRRIADRRTRPHLHLQQRRRRRLPGRARRRRSTSSTSNLGAANRMPRTAGSDPG